MLFSLNMAACFAETSGSKPGGPRCPGEPGGECGCLKLSVLNFEKHRGPYILTVGRTVMFSAKIPSAFVFFKEV